MRECLIYGETMGLYSERLHLIEIQVDFSFHTTNSIINKSLVVKLDKDAYSVSKGTERRLLMRIQYNKLWKVLIDKDMKKKDLQNAASFSSYTIAKLKKNEPISMKIFVKTSTSLDV